MYQTRQETTTKLPIPRKGTKYIARALSHHRNAVPVVVAVRDMLKLAKTADEVKKMIKSNLLKINGRIVKDYRESIRLFNILEADKHYVLTLLPTRKFAFEESKDKDARVCKVTNKKLLKSNTMQVNLHDGSNILTKDKINVGDSIYIDFSNKIKKHLSFEKGKEVFVMSGKYSGLKGKVDSIEGKKVSVKFAKGAGEAQLAESQLIII